jgi:hypothetical protein
MGKIAIQVKEEILNEVGEVGRDTSTDRVSSKVNQARTLLSRDT